MSRERLRRRVNAGVGLWALGVAALDSLTKWWARHDVSAHPRALWGPFQLRLSYNAGVSFSTVFAGPIATALTILVIVLVISWVAFQATPGWPTVGFGLMLGGGASNEVDRVLSPAHVVTDFLYVKGFAVINVADVAVSVGVAILVVCLARRRMVLS